MADLLNPDALHHAVAQLPGWSGTSDGLHKTYRFSSYADARRFVDRVADLAEQYDHHPDITLGYGTVAVHLVTHSAGGVTQNDLDLATRIESGEAHGDANPDNPRAGETR